MQMASRPHPKRAFSDRNRAALTVLVLLLCSLVGQSQIIQYPNPGLYGQGMRRGAWDSVVYLPTGCGVPVGKAGLRSYGFNGFGQKLNQIAIFGDTCGHHVYWYDPTDSTWARLDSAGSGGGGGSAGSSDSLKKYPVDTSANPRNGYFLTFDSTNHKWKLTAPAAVFDSAASQGGVFHTGTYNDTRYLKKGDSATAYATPKRVADTAAVLRALIAALTGTDTTIFKATGLSGLNPFTLGSSGGVNQINFPKFRDTSAAATQYAGDSALTIATHDSTSANALQTKHNTDTARVNIYAGLNSKMTNFGGAPGQLQGTYAGIPAATSYATGTTYIAQDSGFQYVDTGSGGSRGWKKISGGAGSGGGSQNLASVVAQHGSFSADDSSDLAGHIWYVKNGKLKVDNVISSPNPLQASDSILFPGTSITLGATGTSSIQHRFSKQVANKYNVFEANYGISGGTLLTQGFAQLTSIQNWSRAKYMYWVIEWGPNDIQASSTPDSTTFAGKVSAYLDSLITNRGFPASRGLWVAPGYIDSTQFANATTLRQRQFKNAIISVCTSKGVKAFSMYDIEVSRGWQKYLNADGLHPNDGGHGLYAWAIIKNLPDSVPNNAQALAVNGLTELQKVKERITDTADRMSVVTGLDSNGRHVRYAYDDIPVDKHLRQQAQAIDLNLAGTIVAGNIANAVLPPSTVIYTSGTIQGGSFTVTSGPPAGWNVNGGHLTFSSNVFHIYGFDYGTSTARAIAMNELGQPVMIGTATATGTNSILQVSGQAEATGGIRATGSWSGTRSGLGAELGGNGTVGYIVATNASGGVGLNLGAGLSPTVTVGVTTITGSSLFQVNGSGFLNGKWGIQNSAPSALLQISGAQTSPTTGRRGTYFSSDTASEADNQDIAIRNSHFLGRKTINMTSAHVIALNYNTKIEKDSGNANTTFQINRSLLTTGTSVFNDTVLLGNVPLGAIGDTAKVLVKNADSSVRYLPLSTLLSGTTLATSGRFLSSTSNPTNATASVDSIVYTKIGNAVQCKISGSWSGVSVANSQFEVTVPVTNVTWSTGDVYCGTGSWYDLTVGTHNPINAYFASATTVRLQMLLPTTNTGSFAVIIMYDAQ